jgi:hypothetical protein
MLRTQAQIIEVSGDLLLHIVEGLKRIRAQNNRSKSKSSGFDVLGGGKKAVESQVLIKSVS